MTTRYNQQIILTDGKLARDEVLNSVCNISIGGTPMGDFWIVLTLDLCEGVWHVHFLVSAVHEVLQGKQKVSLKRVMNFPRSTPPKAK